MITIEAYTVDEWREKLGLSSDTALGLHFGVSLTSVQHYRKKQVHLGVTGGKLKRVSDMRVK